MKNVYKGQLWVSLTILKRSVEEVDALMDHPTIG